jgi:DNA-binding transcriptional LysR family regulator
MINKIELPWLLSFQSVYEQRSFKQAASQLDLPSSNVSRHVALLEEALNLRLLERTTRRMSPTEAGKQVYDQVIPLLAALDEELEGICQQSQQVSGHLRILMPDLPILARQLASFCAIYPHLTLSCETGLVPDEGILDGLDMIIQFGRGGLKDSDWVATELMRWPSVVVATPEFTERYKADISLNNLINLPCITTLSALNGSPWVFKKGRQTSKVDVISQYRVNSANMAKEAALAHLGLAILAKPSCLNELQQGTLIEIKLEQEPADLVLYAYSGKLKKSAKKVKALLEYLKDQNTSTNLHPI